MVDVIMVKKSGGIIHPVFGGREMVLRTVGFRVVGGQGGARQEDWRENFGKVDHFAFRIPYRRE